MNGNASAHGQRKRRVTWRIEVPLMRNRLMWREVGSVLSAFWLASCALVSLGFWLAARENPQEVQGNLLTALLVISAVYWGSFLLTIFLYFWLKGRQVFLFDMNHEQATSKAIRGKGEKYLAGAMGVLASFAGDRGLASSGAVDAAQSPVRRQMSWRQLRKVKFHPDLLAISLYRWPWPAQPLVLYLPHQAGYDRVKVRLPQLCPQLRLP